MFTITYTLFVFYRYLLSICSGMSLFRKILGRRNSARSLTNSSEDVLKAEQEVKSLCVELNSTQKDLVKTNPKTNRPRKHSRSNIKQDKTETPEKNPYKPFLPEAEGDDVLAESTANDADDNLSESDHSDTDCKASEKEFDEFLLRNRYTWMEAKLSRLR